MPAQFNLNPSARRRTVLFYYKLISAVWTRVMDVDGLYQGPGTTFAVPLDVTEMDMDASGPGGGGGGGHTGNGGGGGGGGPGSSVRGAKVHVTPGSTLTVNVGRAGLGGAAGFDGETGAAPTTIDGIVYCDVPLSLASGVIVPGSAYPQMQLYPGNGGSKGTATNGGASGAASYGFVAGAGTGTGVGGNGTFPGIDFKFFAGVTGGAGGGPGLAGGIAPLAASGNAIPGGFSQGAAPGNGSTIGGGGGGGHSYFSAVNGHSRGGRGDTLAAAQDGVWGGGGGGGYAGVAGGRGGDGFVRLSFLSRS